LEALDLVQMLAGWPITITPSLALTPLAGGTNNQAWLVETAGASYVLRLSHSVGVDEQAHLRYEVALLAALRAHALAFSVPCPLLTLQEEPFLLVKHGEGTVMAVLTPFLPGCIPERTASNIVSAGIALAQLDGALASVSASTLPASVEITKFLYGDLLHCHPLVSNPFATVEQILEPDQARPLRAIFEHTQHDWEALCTQDLPQQILHRDYGPGNVLMEQQHVTALLDFEFAGRDHRLFDLCVALSWWPVRAMGTGREWELIDAFGRAYTALFPLTEEELLALPAAFRMRDTTSLVYRIGRYLAGLETRQTILERVQHSFWREEWLLANQATLLKHLLSWRGISTDSF